MEKLKNTQWGLLFLALTLLVLLGVLGNRVFRSYREPQFFCGVVDSIGAPHEPDPLTRGDSIYNANCARCHYTSDVKMVGPGLKRIFERAPTPPEKWVRAYLSNTDSLVATGDAYAIALRQKYHPGPGLKPFNHHFRFTEKDWADLLAVLKVPASSAARLSLSKTSSQVR